LEVAGAGLLNQTANANSEGMIFQLKLPSKLFYLV
jgi:hypothetical protein